MLVTVLSIQLNHKHRQINLVPQIYLMNNTKKSKSYFQHSRLLTNKGNYIKKVFSLATFELVVPVHEITYLKVRSIRAFLFCCVSYQFNNGQLIKMPPNVYLKSFYKITESAKSLDHTCVGWISLNGRLVRPKLCYQRSVISRDRMVRLRTG